MRKGEGDAHYMERAGRLALQALGNTSPNPMVGAVIVKGGRIISEGYHRAAGFPHAEIDAIKNAKCSLSGSTMYVTLEPCSHYGKTPPCVEAIVKSGIKRVVIGEIDPNPLVNGKGISYLRKYGVEVDILPVADGHYSINCGFKKWIKKKIPYVTLKVASSMDGRIADIKGDAKYLTSNKTREFVHFIRYISDAIMVGARTVRTDDPLLDHRLYKLKKKKLITRIILDGNLSLTPDFRVFRDDGAKRIILTSYNAFNSKKGLVKRFIRCGVEIVPFKTIRNHINVKDILEYLGMINILFLLVEGGKDVFTDFIDSYETDLFVQMIAPRIIGDGSSGFYGRSRLIKNSLTGFSLYNVSYSGRDALLIYNKEGSDVCRLDTIYRESQELKQEV